MITPAVCSVFAVHDLCRDASAQPPCFTHARTSHDPTWTALRIVWLRAIHHRGSPTFIRISEALNRLRFSSAIREKVQTIETRRPVEPFMLRLDLGSRWCTGTEGSTRQVVRLRKQPFSIAVKAIFLPVPLQTKRT